MPSLPQYSWAVSGPRSHTNIRSHEAGPQPAGDAPCLGMSVPSIGSDVAPTLDLGRNDPDDVRLASWNVQSDALWNGGAAEAAQNRLLDAVDPDVLILCEVWNHSASQTAAKIETFLPSGAGESWSAVKLDQGNVIVSRFPILDSWEVNPGYRITAALLDLGAGFDTDLLVIANHWRCCTDDASRQEEADSVVEFLADMRSPGAIDSEAP